MESHSTRLAAVALLMLACSAPALADDAPAQVTLPDARPVPLMQAVPLPHDRVSLRRGGAEIARYHFAADQRRPFVHPVIGPGSGRSLTRMGHPHDPVSHSHHNSVWVSHNKVNGVSFWTDHGRGRGTIGHERVEKLEDGDGHAAVQALNRWVDAEGKTLLMERRRTAVRPLPNGEWLLVIDLQFEPAGDEPVTFEQDPFGLIGVRMAKPIGIHDGGGMIRNSEGNVNEQGPNGCFRKPARWCDYSGRITNEHVEGVTLFDHPENMNHPAPFHVRGDGWMGACLTLEEPITVEPGKPLRLRYGLYVHRGAPVSEWIDRRWAEFAESKVEPLESKR